MRDVYIVWNKNRSEGAVFTSQADAKDAAGIKRVKGCRSALADHFEESYADDGKLKVEKVSLP